MDTLIEVETKINQLTVRKQHREKLSKEQGDFFERIEEFQQKEQLEAVAKKEAIEAKQQVLQRKRNEERKKPLDPNDLFAVSK